MKLYVLLLLVFVVGLVVGCSQATPSRTTTTTNNQDSQDYTPSGTQDTQANNVPVDNTPTETTPLADNTPTPIDSTSGISLSALAVHNSQSDCWIAYNNKVYDITKFLPIHPGGANRIIPYCGTASEFEQAFTRKHGTSQVGKLMQQGIYEGDLQ